MSKADQNPSVHATQSGSSVSRPGIVARGVAMGIAEVVPGVSGGTIAFVTGIYDDLIGSLASFGPSSIVKLRSPAAFWHYHNLTFLVLLGVGMVLGAVSFARLMQYLLANYQPLVWAFFLGVILASVWIIGSVRERTPLITWFPLGLLVGIGLLFVPPISGDPSLLELFFGGAIAVSAWLLPAISGSYLLLILGMYETLVSAIAEFDLTVLSAVAAGCVAGVLTFTKVLAWCLRRFREGLLSFLCGFMLGSAAKLWPWQLNQSEHAGLPWQVMSTPEQYQVASGEPHMLVFACLMLILGGGLLWLFGRVSTP